MSSCSRRVRVDSQALAQDSSGVALCAGEDNVVILAVRILGHHGASRSGIVAIDDEGIREIPIAPEMAETAHCSPRISFIREVVIYRVNQFRD